MSSEPIKLSAEDVLNEYHNRLAGMMGESIRHACVIARLEEDRNRAWARVTELEAQLHAQGNEAEAFHVGSPPGVRN